LQATANKGGGWYDYDSTDPLSKKIKAKSTYTRRLPSGDGFVGVGIYR
jgi:signal transduction histidine kinase